MGKKTSVYRDMALEDLLVVQMKIWQTGWVPVDNN